MFACGKDKASEFRCVEGVYTHVRADCPHCPSLGPLTSAVGNKLNTTALHESAGGVVQLVSSVPFFIVPLCKQHDISEFLLLQVTLVCAVMMHRLML